MILLALLKHRDTDRKTPFFLKRKGRTPYPYKIARKGSTAFASLHNPKMEATQHANYQ